MHQNPSQPPPPLVTHKSTLPFLFYSLQNRTCIIFLRFQAPFRAAHNHHGFSPHLAARSSPNVIEYGKDEGALENVLLNFESRLSGSDDYIFLLQELGNRGDRKRAICCFEFTSEKGEDKEQTSPIWLLIMLVIDACGKEGVEFKLVVEIFDEMLRNGVQPDRITFNSLLLVCSRGGLLAQADALRWLSWNFYVAIHALSPLLIPLGIMFYGLSLLKLFERGFGIYILSQHGSLCCLY
ncbi:unnamed protein product [Dovyalis caffra]|uniref:Pentatricopeptide repeat-containing protein n=1 Tax=Dovyalis caffra TaxID=77055 RepID=A0AAV1SS12_9ROSI|nr:unnamed protein product [Dovyalis caffra]